MLRRLLLKLKRSTKQSSYISILQSTIRRYNKKYWAPKAPTDVASLKVNINLNEIENMSTKKFSKICKKKVTDIASKHFEEKKSKLNQ